MLDPNTRPPTAVVKKRKRSLARNYPSNSSDTTSSLTSSSAYLEFQQQLPIYVYRDELIQAFCKHQVIILVGETGSGKTTQYPQYVLEALHQVQLSAGSKPKPNGYRIAITQPRRVAAMSVADRVAKERQVKLGKEVGYTVRFDDCTSRETQLKFMTDGMLVRESMLFPSLDRYDCIILDEAHERTLQTDILFGIVKRALETRSDLHVVVMSATLNISLFQHFFTLPTHQIIPKIMRIPGRQFPVQILYTEQAQIDYLDAALISILQIHAENQKLDEDTGLLGSILVFLTGQEDIENVQQLLEGYMQTFPPEWPALKIYPMYAALSPEKQLKVFESVPSTFRKVILATNIAETSITIPGIRYVIDTGLYKQRCYLPRTGMDTLLVEPISKDQSWQRSGRAGREAPGVCYRLMPEAEFEKLATSAIPEIQRVSLENVVLTLKCMQINSILDFPFIEKPSKIAILKALETLYALQALDASGQITPLGKQMAALPLSPMFAKLLLHANALHCVQEALSIVAMLSVESIFYYPRNQREQGEASRRIFISFEGDYMTLLNIYQAYQNCPPKERAQWCQQYYINARSMRRVVSIRDQLSAQMVQMKYAITTSCLPDSVPLQKAIAQAFFLNTAVRSVPPKELKWSGNPHTAYRTLKGNYVKIHPSSAFSGRSNLPKYLIFHELIFTTHNYIRTCVSMEKEWLIEAAPKFFRQAVSTSTSSSTSGRKA